MRYAIAAAILAAAALTSAAAPAYTIKGGVTCEEIMTEHDIEDYRNMNRWWLLGYITARNMYEDADVGYGVDDELIYDRAYKFCAGNLDMTWNDAAYSVYENML